MCSRSSSWTGSFPDTSPSHVRHNSSHAALWRSSAAGKSLWRAADLAALSSVSLTAGSRDVEKGTIFSTRVASPWRTSKARTCWM